jgi:hypothetical protein
MAPRRSRRSTSNNLRYVAIRPSCATRSPDAASAQPTSGARPLRVVRVVDGRTSTCSNRVVISGRMADVCAELDRLAALECRETAQATSHAH